eukprot:4640846-Amphidinium_carterae.1
MEDWLVRCAASCGAAAEDWLVRCTASVSSSSSVSSIDSSNGCSHACSEVPFAGTLNPSYRSARWSAADSSCTPETLKKMTEIRWPLK